MSGIYAFLLGIAAILGAFIFGKAKGTKETTTKIKGEVTIQRTEKELVKDVTPLVVETAKEQTEAQAEYEATVHEIGQASKASDMDWMKRIASDLAKKALEKGATEK